MTKSTFENMFQTIPLVQKGMEIGSSPIPKEQAEHFPGCVSGTLYYAEKQNESQCVAFGVTFPEYYVVAATLQDGRQISIRKETEEELYDLLYRVFYAPERITEPNNYGEYRRSHSVAFFTFSFGLRSSHGIPIPHINAHLLEIMDIFTFPNGETKMHKHRSKKKLPRFAGKLFLCQILCMVILAIFVLVLQSGQYRIVAQRKSVVHENICSRDQS